MIWHLLGALFAALGAAGVAQILRVATRRKLPKWIIPIAAGIGLLGYQIQYEYSWFEHKQALLPAGSEVVESTGTTFFWRPWTYAWPMVTSFAVVDRANARYVEQDGQRIAQFILYRFHKEYVDQVKPYNQLLNCDTAELASEGQNSVRPIEREGELYRVVCG